MAKGRDGLSQDCDRVFEKRAEVFDKNTTPSGLVKTPKVGALLEEHAEVCVGNKHRSFGVFENTDGMHVLEKAQKFRRF